MGEPMFRLEFDINNDAFAEDPQAMIAATLKEVAARVGYGQKAGTIQDVNGNTIGMFGVDPSDLMLPQHEPEA